MKRADLRVGMHVRTGLNRREFWWSEGFVLDLEPWQNSARNYSHVSVRGSGNGVAIAERNRTGWIPKIVPLGSIAPYDDQIERERRGAQARQEYVEAEQLRKKLWEDEVSDLREAVAKELDVPISGLYLSGGRDRPMVTLKAETLRALVERAK